MPATRIVHHYSIMARQGTSRSAPLLFRFNQPASAARAMGRVSQTSRAPAVEHHGFEIATPPELFLTVSPRGHVRIGD